MTWLDNNTEKETITIDLQDSNPAQDAAREQERLNFYSQIPKFGKTTKENQEILDDIVNNFDYENAIAATNFGKPLLDEDLEFNKGIIKQQKDTAFALAENPIQKLSEYMTSDNVKNIHHRTNEALKNGGAIAKRNLPVLAGAAVLSTFAPLVGIFAAASGVAINEKVRKMRTKPDVTAKLVEDLNKELLNYGNFIKKVEEGAAKIPNAQATINQSGNKNIELVQKLALILSASEEIIRRYKEIELPKASKENDRARYFNLETASQQFVPQVAVLWTTHKNAVSNINVLGALAKTYTTSAKNAASILGPEQSMYAKSLSTACIAVTALIFNKDVENFRTNAHEITLQTMKVTEASAVLAENNKIDSVQNIKRANEIMTTSIELVKNVAKISTDALTERKEALRQLENNCNMVMKQNLTQQTMRIEDADLLFVRNNTESTKEPEKVMKADIPKKFW